MLTVDFGIPLRKGGNNPYLEKLGTSIHEQEYPVNKVLYHTGDSQGMARKIITNKSDADIIAWVDSDCILPDKHWLTKMMAPFDDEEVVLTWTLGTYHDYDPWIMKYAIDSNPYHEGMVPGTGHTLMRRNSILDAGNFRVAGCEDKDLVLRMKGKFVYIPDAKVYHYHATTIWQFLWKKWRAIWHCYKVGIR